MTALFSHGRRTLAAALVLLLGVMVGGVSVITDAAPANATTATTSISGTITLPSGAPAAWMNGVYVDAQSIAGNDASGSVDPQTGAYSISYLTPGAYLVRFNVGRYTDPTTQQEVSPNLPSEYFGGTDDFASATPVSTSVSVPATGVNITLALGATISGTLQVPAGFQPDAFEAYYVHATGPAHDLIWGFQSLSTSWTDQSGNYSLSGLLPGSYKVLLRYFGGGTVQAYVGGASYSAASTITVAAGASVSGQDAEISETEGSASPPAAPALVASSSSVTWAAPASEDPILSYSVSSEPVGPYGYYGWDVAATTSSGEFTTVQTDGRSTLVRVSAETSSARSAYAAIALNDPNDAPAPPAPSVDLGQDALTVTESGSLPTGAQWWFDWESADGTVALDSGASTGENSHTFEGVDATAGGTLYAGWYDPAGSRSQIVTLPIASVVPSVPTVNPWFEALWEQLGGASGSLGQPTAVMQCQSSSCWQQFTGEVLTSDGSEIVELSTAYVSTWLANGGPDGELGLVAGPESCFGTYCVTPFTHGVVTWTPNVGVTATVVNAWFEAKWKQLGGVTGSIGSPTAAMQCQSSSCWQQFTGGVLTSDGTQIVKLSSAYVSTWLAWGGPNGDLGLVNGSEACYGTYCQTPFAGGVIVWVPNSGVYPVAKNWFLPAWTAHGGASGSLGLPAAGMQCQSAACYQVFTGGTLTSSTTGIVALSSAYVSTWLADGGPGGSLGLVAGPEVCHSTYCQVPFQHGSLIWQPGVGVRIGS